MQLVSISTHRKKSVEGKISSLGQVLSLFEPHFETSSAAQKNSPHDWFGPAASMIREAQTVFCLTRLGRPQNGDFSKAICTLPGIDFYSNLLMPVSEK
jgi:hypothetical protein